MNEGNIVSLNINKLKIQENIESKNAKIKTILKSIVFISIILCVLLFHENNLVMAQINKDSIKQNSVIDVKNTSELLYKPFNNIQDTEKDPEYKKTHTFKTILKKDYIINSDFLLNQLLFNLEKQYLIDNSIIKYVNADNGLKVRNENMEVIDTLPLNSQVTILIEKHTEDKQYDLILYNNEYAYINNNYLSLNKKDIKRVNKEITHKTIPNSSSSQKGTYLGSFSTTAYCNCSKCCGKWAGGPTASGTTPTAGRTIAVDPKVIPLGTKVIINGKTYIAEDTGSAIKGNKIDIYHSSHSSALQWGRRTVDVYLAS